jgi:hypothetical protein
MSVRFVVSEATVRNAFQVKHLGGVTQEAALAACALRNSS